MDVCLSCGEPLELIDLSGERAGSQVEGAALPGAPHPEPPHARLVCKVCHWPPPQPEQP